MNFEKTSYLKELYSRHWDFVYRTCMRYIRDKDTTEDMVQETFLKIAGALDRFRGDSEVRTWLYRVAVNQCLGHLRSLGRQDRNLRTYLDEMVVMNLSAGGDRILAKLVLERILSKFRPQVRRILFLSLAEGLTYAETAEVLQISQAAVSKCVSRFLKQCESTYFQRKHTEMGFFRREKVESGDPDGPDSTHDESVNVEGKNVFRK